MVEELFKLHETNAIPLWLQQVLAKLRVSKTFAITSKTHSTSTATMTEVTSKRSKRAAQFECKL